MAPVELMEYVLNDSNHSDVCKPTTKDHQSYKDFFDFIQGLFSNLRALVVQNFV